MTLTQAYRPEPASGGSYGAVVQAGATVSMIVHRGSTDAVLTTVQTPARWIESAGRTANGLSGEFHPESGGPQGSWVTEIQQPPAPLT